MRTGQGAMLCCQLRRFLRDHSTAHTTSGCGKPSAGPHLVQPASPFTHCLIRCVMVLLLLLFSGTRTLPDLFKHKWVRLIFYCWAGGVVHLVLVSIKCLTIGRFCLSAFHCQHWAELQQLFMAIYVRFELKHSNILCTWVVIHMLCCVYDSRLEHIKKPLFFTHTLTVWCRCRPIVLYLDAIQRLVWV